MSGKSDFFVNSMEMIGLYLFLRDQDSLDITLSCLLTRLEKIIHHNLSIEEFEHLEEIYRDSPGLIQKKDFIFEDFR